MSEAFDVVSTIATVAAAILAYLTIRQSAKVSDENQRALVRERRIDFELGVLSEITEKLDVLNQSAHIAFRRASEMGNTRLRAWVQLLDNDQLPLVRVLAGCETSVFAEEEFERIHSQTRGRNENPVDTVLDACRAEVREAVRSRMIDRERPPHRRWALPRRRREPD